MREFCRQNAGVSAASWPERDTDTVTESFRWQGWLDSALPGEEPFGRSARIEIGTRTISAEELRELATRRLCRSTSSSCRSTPPSSGGLQRRFGRSAGIRGAGRDGHHRRTNPHWRVARPRRPGGVGDEQYLATPIYGGSVDPARLTGGGCNGPAGSIRTSAVRRRRVAGLRDRRAARGDRVGHRVRRGPHHRATRVRPRARSRGTFPCAGGSPTAAYLRTSWGRPAPGAEPPWQEPVLSERRAVGYIWLGGTS